MTAVELLPIHEFDELEFQRMPNPRSHMVNTWGYSTVSFMAPMFRGRGGTKLRNFKKWERERNSRACCWSLPFWR